MNVTDEMVRAARKAWSEHCATSATTLDDILRDALEAALSHAAGQEATTNPAEIGRKSVGAGQEAVAVDFVDEIGRDGKPTGYIIREGSPAHASHELAQIHARLLTEADNLLAFAIKRSNLVTPAQPPASAEVGREDTP